MTKLLVELGGGQAPIESGRINLDALTGSDGHRLDVRKGLPFADGSVAEFRSSDFYEHLTFEEGLALMRECKRCLILGGFVDFTIPDMEAAFRYHNHGPGTGWCHDLELCIYGSRESEWQTHKAWYTPSLLKYVWAQEGWRVETQFTKHGWPHQPKARILAWPK